MDKDEMFEENTWEDDIHDDEEELDDEGELDDEEMIRLYGQDDSSECTCGNYYCKECNRDLNPLSEEQEEALESIKNSFQISIDGESFQHEGEFDEYNNPYLTSESSMQNKRLFSIRDVASIDGKIIYCKDSQSEEYIVKIDEACDEED